MQTPSEFFKERLGRFGEMKIYVHPLLPRIEKIYTKEKSTLEKQSANVLLTILSGKKDFPRLIDQKTVHFIHGTYQGEKFAFVSAEVNRQLEESFS